MSSIDIQFLQNGTDFFVIDNLLKVSSDNVESPTELTLFFSTGSMKIIKDDNPAKFNTIVAYIIAHKIL